MTMNAEHVLNELRKLKTQENSLGLVQLMGTDVDGQMRGKALAQQKFSLNSFEKGFGLCSVIFDWDCMDDTIGIRAEKETSYPDLIVVPDPSTLIIQPPWEPAIPTMIVDFCEFDSDGNLKPFVLCPRQLLKSVIKSLHDAGYDAMIGMELEWYNFQESPESIRAKNYQNLSHLTQGMTGYSIQRPTTKSEFCTDLLRSYKQLCIPLECFHMETGPGVYEAALSPCRPLEAADRNQLLRLATRIVGARHNILPSFMAKPFAKLPGSGCHIHISLWSMDGTLTKGSNLFASEKKEDGSIEPNEMMLFFMGGILQCLPDIMPMLGPNVNSYKRLDPTYWAPVALSWGRDNRSTAIRWIASEDAKMNHIEVRIGGADLNSYFAVAALLAAGMYGINHRILPGPPSESPEKLMNDPNTKFVPLDLASAVARMKDPKSLARVLFGDAFVTRFIRTREWELKLFSQAITDFETKRYLEFA